MGSIVSFVPRKAARERRGVRSNDEGASVIIFPGVRYERPIEIRPGNTSSVGKKAEQQNTGPSRH